MALGGLRMQKNWRGISEQPIKQPKSVVGKVGSKAVGTIKESLDTLDKVHETRLKNTGLLDSKEWTKTLDTEWITDPVTLARTPLQKNIDLFKRVPGQDPSLNPMSYYKRTTTPTFQRIQINPEFFSEGGGTFQEVAGQLTESGYSHKQILDIARNTPQVEIIPYTKMPKPLLPNQIMDVEPSGLSEALGKIEGTVGKGLTTLGGTVGEGLTTLGGGIGEFGGSIGEFGGSIVGKGAEFGSDIMKSLDLLGGVGGKAADYSKFVLGTVLGKGEKTIGKVAGHIGKGIGKVGEVGGKTADYSKFVLGTALGKGGTAIGKALPVIGQTVSGARGVKGLEQIFKGENIAQGVEDTIQGAIGVASPFLLAAGPAGWGILAASFLEDLFFD